MVQKLDWVCKTTHTYTHTHTRIIVSTPTLVGGGLKVFPNLPCRDGHLLEQNIDGVELSAGGKSLKVGVEPKEHLF